MGRWLSGSWVLLLLTSPAAGASKLNVDFSVGWNGHYRPMEWTPVYIEVSAKLREPFGGTANISVQQDDMTRMTVARQFVLTPDLPARLPLVTKVAFGAEAFRVWIADDRGRRTRPSSVAVFIPGKRQRA